MSIRHVVRLAGKKCAEVIRILIHLRKLTASLRNVLNFNKGLPSAECEPAMGGFFSFSRRRPTPRVSSKNSIYENVNEDEYFSDGSESFDESESISVDDGMHSDPEADVGVFFTCSGRRHTPQLSRKNSLHTQSVYENVSMSHDSAYFDGMETFDQPQPPISLPVSPRQSCEKERLENVLNETLESLATP